jgi:hypothetical protein
MKLLKLVPLAGLVVAGSSFADPNAPAADFTIYASGASAQLATIGGALTSLCQPNVVGGHQIRFYQGHANPDGSSNPAANANNNLRAYRCTLKAGSPANPAIDNKTILFVYSAIDGSASGVQFVARNAGETRQFINFASCPATASVGTTGSTAADLALTPANSQRFNCNVANTVSTIAKVSVAGSSDVEPSQFTNDNAPSIGDVSESDLAELEVRAGRAVLFGVYANSAMWLELQKRQGILPPTATAAVMPSTAGFAPAQRPNMTVLEYRNIVTGNASNMSLISGNGKPVAGTMTAGPYTLARRVKGSGTQAMSNIYFLNNGCGIATGTALTPADASFSDANGQTVIEGSGSSNVVAELNNVTRPAIGVLSLETPATANFAPLLLDGVLPNRANAIAGQYNFYGEETFQWSKTKLSAAVDPSGPNKVAILERLVRASAAISSLSLMSQAAQDGSAALSAFNGAPSTSPTWILQGARNSNNCLPASKVN